MTGGFSSSGTVVVLGEAVKVAGFALAGAVVLVAEDAGEVRRTLDALPADTTVIVLTARAARTVADESALGERVLSVVMPP